MKKLSLFFLLCLISVVTHQAFAVPAVPWPVEKVQPDGTKFSVYLKGDERVHWMESLDGYTLMYDSQENIVFAEQNSAGDLVPSKVKYGEPALRSSEAKNFKKGLRYSRSQIAAMKQKWEIADKEIQKTPKQLRASLATSKKALCVLVRFSDKAFVHGVSEFEALMNQSGYDASAPNAGNDGKGSVSDFFYENSYGQLDFSVDVVGPYQAPKTAAYYASHEQEFAKWAAEAANVDVNFNDYAVGGNLETFHIIFAGYGDEASGGTGKQIWSHKWQLAIPITLDGVRVSVYSCSPELRGGNGNTLTAIGVVCHELSHVFGSPDYYDTDYDKSGGEYPGTGNWDLMASGSWNDNGTSPAHINMFQKIKYGWVTPEYLTSFKQVVDMPNSAENPVAYIIKADDNKEEYILENRQKIGFDQAIPGHGLLIYHVMNCDNRDASNAAHPQQMYVVAASSSTAIPNSNPNSYGNVNSTGAPFPGTSNKTEFTDNTIPQAFSWATMQGIGKSILNIAEADKKISFSFGSDFPDAVINLSASITNKTTVTLNWTEPNDDRIIGYKIYRNDEFLTTISGKEITAYSQENVSDGTYNYCVTSISIDMESSKAYTEVTVLDQFCMPVTNLTTSVSDRDVTLNWEAPVFPHWKGYHNHTSGNPNFYSVALSDYNIAIRWIPGELNTVNGYKVDKVRFWAPSTTNIASTVYSVCVWMSNDLNPIVDQVVTTVIPNGWNEISLNTPVTIDASKNLYVGLRCNNTTGAFPIPATESGNIEGRGNMFKSGGSWGTVGIPGNYIIDAYVSFPELNTSLTPTIVGYEVSRDGIVVGIATTTEFTETVPDHNTYNYCVKVIYANDIYAEPVCTEVAINHAIWKGLTSNWHTPTNWHSGVIPNSNTVVYIPEGVPNFPVLTGIITDNVCKEIYFSPGAEIGHQELLTYEKAHIQLSFGENGLFRDQWHTLSMPIGSVYTGDFNFGGYPYTFLKKFTTSESEGLVRAGWTNFSGNNVPLAIGEGFALWVNPNDGGKGYCDSGSGVDTPFGSTSRNYGLGEVNGIIELPYFENEAISTAHRVHKYEHGSSFFYGFSTTDGLPLSNESVSVARESDAYRLAGNNVNVPVKFGEDNSSAFALAGNPFMSTINFSEFYTENAVKIKESYQVWTGISFSGYTEEGTFGNEGLTEFIAPMQSFIVERIDASTGNDNLTFKTDHSATNNSSQLRASANTIDKLDIIASNDVASVLTFIAKREGGQNTFSNRDSRKIIMNTNNVPEIYTLKDAATGKIAVGGNIISTDNILIPVGLVTAFEGKITLTFKGMDNYNAHITLIDRIENKEIELSELPSYEYFFNNVPKRNANNEIIPEEERFVVRFTPADITGIDNVFGEVLIYSKENAIHVISSSSDLIKQIYVYNTHGQVIYANENIDASSYVINDHKNIPEVCIVKLITNSGVKNLKIIN